MQKRIRPTLFSTIQKSLTKFNDNVAKKPKFLCVIVGIGFGLTRDPKSGVYVVPYNTLGMHFNV